MSPPFLLLFAWVLRGLGHAQPQSAEQSPALLKCKSHSEALSPTHPEMMFPPTPARPVGQSSWHLRLAAILPNGNRCHLSISTTLHGWLRSPKMVVGVWTYAREKGCIYPIISRWWMNESGSYCCLATSMWKEKRQYPWRHSLSSPLWAQHIRSYSTLFYLET